MPIKQIGLAALLGLLLTSSLGSSACSVPVFRYALERWPNDPYWLVIFHKGKLTAEQQKVVDLLDAPVNCGAIRYQLVDVAKPDEIDTFVKPLWDKVKGKGKQFPLLHVYYPQSSGITNVLWEGGLTQGNIKKILDSPARRKISRALLKGDSAVWLLIKSGVAEKDAAAEEVLKRTLPELSKDLQLSDMTPDETVEDIDSRSGIEIKLAFSMIKIDHRHPEESFLVRAITHSEPDVDPAKEPIALAVYGRGRALPLLLGKGINGLNVREMSSFLVGPCSCQVKAENPGFDLPFNVNWERLVFDIIDLNQELPPIELKGFEHYRPVDKQTGKPEENASTPDPERAPMGNSGNGMVVNVIIALAMAAAVVIVGSVVMTRLQRRGQK